ncbi:UspA [Gossypium australe]|uniref:UspA n=1 Tax=Gossypium australe TaxID=47621 RepID=A0A5B6UJR8_9ROSI|nr:UspA [Gossypium australe]
MAFAHYLFAVPMDTSIHPKISIPPSFCSTESPSSLPFPSFSSPFPPLSKARNLSIFPRINRVGHKAKAQARESEVNIEPDAFSHFKHLLLPITDRNPYLSEGTRQLSMKSRKSRCRSMKLNWQVFAGISLKEFKLLERLGEGSKPTAIIGEVADDLNLDLVVMSMEAIHSKHVDANLLAEFIPCPVLLLPL